MNFSDPATSSPDKNPVRDLELLSRRGQGARQPVSLLFVHGINVGSWIWEAHFLDYFAEAGFDAHALSLRGHGQSWGVDRIASWTLADYVEDLRQAVARIDGPVILVGHSLGGAVVQKFIQSGGRAAGMALLSSVPPWGLAPSALRMAMTAPRAFRVLLEMSSGALPPEDPALARQILFDADTSDEGIMAFLRRVGPESPRIGAAVQGWPPIAPLAPFAPRTFVLGGGQDAIVPSDEVWRTGLYYGTRPEIVPDLGHMVMLGARWKEAAARLQDWLT